MRYALPDRIGFPHPLSLSSQGSLPVPPAFHPSSTHMKPLTLLATAALWGSPLAHPLQAGELSLSPVFSDHMVLQRDKPVLVWGWADPDSVVAVSLAGQSVTASATADGSWIARLSPLAASSQSMELTVTAGTRTIRIKDVLVGEVWLLGGQSNMEMPLWLRGESDGMKNADGTRLVVGTDHPWLRVMTVPQQASPEPQDRFSQDQEDGDGVPGGRWFVSEPKHRAISGFSALGYFIGVQLHERLGVPIGLIDTSWGGTIAAAWNSRASLDSIPESSPLVRRKAAEAAAWSKEGAQQQLDAALAQWEQQKIAAAAAGTNPQGKPELKPDPGQDRNFPAGPFNAMIWPLRHLSLRGVFFYQGENNFFDHEDPFAKTFPAIVSSWRHAFKEPDLPFCLFQICGWENADILYRQTKLPILQEAQHKAHLALPHTGFVVTADYPHVDIHPVVKRVIAERALRWARSEVYGESAVPWGSAALKSSHRDGSRMILKFQTPANEAILVRGDPCGLVIAGPDRKFHEAKARVVNLTSLEVWSDQVPDPIMVRHAWSQRAIFRLTTASGLPIGPFRTDTEVIPDSEIVP